ncbi:MAG: RNA polymerase factor sigma-54 [Betaproteobacteria bacterium]|nr:RNA polymerase factor sigma-54 [Betaproteobacteria bacterium]
MKQSLQLKLSQHLTLTPQLQQSIKLLQLSTMELHQEIERYLLENPLLERTDEWAPNSDGSQQPGADSNETCEASTSLDDDFGVMQGAEDSWAGSAGSAGVANNDDEDSESGHLATAESTLQEHLLSQLALTGLAGTGKQCAAIIIAHIDDEGYLAATQDEIVALLPEGIEYPVEEFNIALRHVQHLEPAGVGARSLSECLDIQLRATGLDTPAFQMARQIAAQHLDLLGNRDYARLKRLLRCSDEEFRDARQLITSLDPKPGRRYGASDTRYITADVVVRKSRGKWQASLNRDVLPKLRVNQHYARLLGQSRSGDAKNLSGQLQEARWLVKNIQQRFDTILRVAQAIVDLQRHFFDHGEVAMKPLVLREVAEMVGLHESTISRVTSQKYMLTPRGIFELKYFFASSLSTDQGGACSSTAIRALIKQIVQAEDTNKPLSDLRIAGLLADQGIVVARRTVAKYRESMQIQPANLRKALAA